MFYEYNINDGNSILNLKQNLYGIINDCLEKNRIIIFYFIGTDRCTGDSLGPLAGERFKDLSFDNILFFGSLENPIHAVNIFDVVKRNSELYKDALTIAVDASLGTKSNIGKVYLQDKPLKPGSALNKSISSVGDYSITGIVNYSDSIDFIVLQNTRLYNVFRLSHFISEAIYQSISEYEQTKKAL